MGDGRIGSANRYEVAFGGDGKILEFDSGDGCTTLWIVYFKMVNFMLCEVYLTKKITQSKTFKK